MIGLVKLIEQSNSEKVNDNKDIRISVVRGEKITTTTASALFASRKLLMVSIKVILPEGKQNIRVKKI